MVELIAFVGGSSECYLCAFFVPAATCNGAVCVVVSDNGNLEEQRVLYLELHYLIFVHLAVGLVGMLQQQTCVFGSGIRRPCHCSVVAEIVGIEY